MPRPLSILLDLVFVTAFVAIGHAIFGGRFEADDLMRAGAPYLAAVLITVIFMTMRRVRMDTLHGGVIVWIATFMLGTLFRVLIGDGFQIPYVLLAGFLLALFLLGWRTPFWLANRPRKGPLATARRSTPKDPRKSGNPAKRNP